MPGTAERAAELLGSPLRRVRALSGGDLSAPMRIELADGRVAVAKAGPDPRAEADMLEALATRIATPPVLAVDDQVLVIGWCDDDGRLERAWSDVGRAVAGLHAAAPRPPQAPAEGYGWPVDSAFGSVPIPNAICEDWCAFWAQRRLLPSCEHLDIDLARRIDALASRLERWLPRKPAPALLHGDLWSGNVLTCQGRLTALIDPACTIGDAEVDLAMLRLFASPDASFEAAYGPLEPGHQDRLPIYQLGPALVHLRLFGSGYRSLVERLLSHCGV